MKRVMVLYSGGRHRGGIETYLANLFRLYDRRVLDLTLLSLGAWELTRELEQQGPPVRSRVLSERRFRPRTVCDIRSILREESADLLVSQGVVANAYARLAAVGTGVPSLVVVHSDLAGDYPATAKRWAYLAADRLLRPVTKRYIAVSHYLEKRLVESGIKAQQVSVIYNGATITRKRSRPYEGAHSPTGQGGVESTGESEKRKKSEDSIRVVSVGRLHAVKNFRSLIAAIPLLPEHVKLAIWGEGIEKAELVAFIDRMGLGDRVDLRGESADAGQAFAEADVYVQPSKSEGFGLTVVEAMLHGKPVVVTPCGSLVELVEDGRTGVVAEGSEPEALAAALMKVVSDRGLAARLAEAGRREAERRFTVDAWLEATTQVFSESAR